MLRNGVWAVTANARIAPAAINDRPVAVLMVIPPFRWKPGRRPLPAQAAACRRPFHYPRRPPLCAPATLSCRPSAPRPLTPLALSPLSRALVRTVFRNSYVQLPAGNQPVIASFANRADPSVPSRTPIRGEPDERRQHDHHAPGA